MLLLVVVVRPCSKGVVQPNSLVAELHVLSAAPAALLVLVQVQHQILYHAPPHLPRPLAERCCYNGIKRENLPTKLVA